jgi:hypothetical protein
MKILLTTIAAALLFSPFALCAADDPINPDRPGIADGSETVGRQKFQIELGLERDHASDSGIDERTISTPLLLRYGLTDRIEARVETGGYQRTTISDGSSSSSLQPVSIGAKFHFLDRQEGRPSLGVIARLFPPSGTGDSRSHLTAGDLRLAADYDLSKKWSLNPNVGVASYEGSDGHRFTAALAAMTLQYNITEKINAFVDGGLQSPEDGHGGSNLQLDTGAAWVIGNDTQLDASVTWTAHGSGANVIWAVGISRRF